MGSPAASAEVQPAGRTSLLFRLKTAPEPALQRLPPFSGYAANSSYSIQLSGSTIRTCRSPVALRPPSIGASGGIGYGPGSDSAAYSNRTGTPGWPPGTTTYGMPLGAPFQMVPKSG